MKDMQQTPTRGYRQLRKGRHSIPGFYYSLTVCTLDKRPLLANTEAADIIFKSFDWLEANDRLEWFCVVVMPDHIHGVIQLGSKQTLPRLMQSFKSFTAKEINAHLGHRGSLWQGACYEHGIRRDESLKAIIRYCYENPVRRGLVKVAKDYLYWQ
jgi:REP element-mobilizing transposase RayT